MTKYSKIQELAYALLIEDTGRALGDSGDAYGRHWQRNSKRTIEDFEADPQAELEISFYGERCELDVTLSVYHKIVDNLALDDLCNEFNALPVVDWDGDFYGTSVAGCAWLEEHGFVADGDQFNTYNGESSLSQVLQGQVFDRDGDKYLLLQVHGGCDVRGGYTDAKLFVLGEEYFFFNDACGFNLDGKDLIIDFQGGNDFTDAEGRYLGGEELDKIARKAGAGKYVGYCFY